MIRWLVILYLKRREDRHRALADALPQTPGFRARYLVHDAFAEHLFLTRRALCWPGHGEPPELLSRKLLVAVRAVDDNFTPHAD